MNFETESLRKKCIHIILKPNKITTYSNFKNVPKALSFQSYENGVWNCLG